ncbi:MAG: glycoside hydrolase family 3 C-terminal domain-containing protein [Phycisphaerae bacterium]|jgi:beta-glucosidase
MFRETAKHRYRVVLLSIAFLGMAWNCRESAGAMNSNKKIKQEIDKMVSKMTLEEKISMVHANTLFTTAAIERLDIPGLCMSDGPHGVREEQKPDDFSPTGLSTDASTYLPTLTALAATWNPDMSYCFGKVLGSEARARGKDVILGPAINIMRTPLCGRNFEYMGEDPYLTSKMVVPYIKGVQENDVAACVKHFALNNQEYKRHSADVQCSERALREIYLPGFKAAVQEGGVLTLMAAYNLFRGQHCCQNEYLLNEILKKEWGFSGAVISDWGGVYNTKEAALNGMDIEMGTKVPNGVRNDFENYFLAKPFLNEIRQGALPESVLDDKVKRILYVMHKINMFDKNRKPGAFNTPDHQKTALDVAQEAIVLLKNDKGLLPIAADVKSIAVIGENAAMEQAHGGGSSNIKAKYEITPLEALQKKLNGRVTLNVAQGYSFQDDASVQKLIDEAVEAAKKSDIVIVFGGLNHQFETEGRDRKDMKLPYHQDKLIRAVAEANPKTIVVLICGSPVEVYQWVDAVGAVVQGWYAGMEAGTAMVNVLFGDVNPSGKLPFTFPVRLEDSPVDVYGDYLGDNEGNIVEYREDILVGYRYYDTKKVAPQFCFGHGLSYTQFEYDKLKISPAQIKAGRQTVVSLEVKNVGNSFGAEVVQLYINAPESSVIRPEKELKGFAKVFLKPGQKNTVRFVIDESHLSFYDESKKQWTAENGIFNVLIGSSSRDIRLKGGLEFNDKTAK